MDKNKRNSVPIKTDMETETETEAQAEDVQKTVSNGIVEDEDGNAYILCGDTKVLLPGGYVRLKS